MYIHTCIFIVASALLFVLLCMCNNELLLTVKHTQVTTSKILVATFYYDTTMIMTLCSSNNITCTVHMYIYYSITITITITITISNT